MRGGELEGNEKEKGRQATDQATRGTVLFSKENTPISHSQPPTVPDLECVCTPVAGMRVQKRRAGFLPSARFVRSRLVPISRVIIPRLRYIVRNLLYIPLTFAP
jgi:hypothetical protein